MPAYNIGAAWALPTTIRAYRDTRLVSIGGGGDEIMLGIICKLEGTLSSTGNKRRGGTERNEPRRSSHFVQVWQSAMRLFRENAVEEFNKLIA
jgi:hypothetical protein